MKIIGAIMSFIGCFVVNIAVPDATIAQTAQMTLGVVVSGLGAVILCLS